MKLDTLKPWNWFKHEDVTKASSASIPIKHGSSEPIHGGSPFDSFLQLHREMDRLFDDAFRSFGMPTLSRPMGSASQPLWSTELFFRPSTDVSGNEKQYTIALELPGMKEEDIRIELKDRVLTIQGEHTSKSEDDAQEYYRVERRYGSFQRTLTLPDDAAADDISATMKDGVLSLTIPRVALPHQDVKRIEIQR